MLKLNIQRIFAGRVIDKPFNYLVKQGFSRNIATRLNSGNVAEIKLKDVERLCLLFQCTPNELLEWIPAEKQQVEDQPLRDLIRVNPKVNIKAVLNSLPYSQLAEMEKFIGEKARKV